MLQCVYVRSSPRGGADGGIPLRHYSTGHPLSAKAVWSPDGRWIYYRALVDGKIAVWQAAADGSEARPVTSDPADIREFSLSADGQRSEEHTSELQSLMRISYAVFCLKKKNKK